MTEMIAAIGSQKVQVALRPSPTTGLTLTATVQGKLNDVQERIRVCKKIMFAARFNVSCVPLFCPPPQILLFLSSCCVLE